MIFLITSELGPFFRCCHQVKKEKIFLLNCDDALKRFISLRKYTNLIGNYSFQVANVRFNVAKTLTIVGPKLNSGVMQSQVKPCINKLNEDSDFDVRFFASEAAMGE